MIDPLMFTVAVLGVIEICLGVVFYKVGQKMWLTYLEIAKLNKNIESAKVEISGVKDKLNGLYVYLKTLGSGSVRLTGDVPMLGKVDLDVKFGKGGFDG